MPDLDINYHMAASQTGLRTQKTLGTLPTRVQGLAFRVVHWPLGELYTTQGLEREFNQPACKRKNVVGHSAMTSLTAL